MPSPLSCSILEHVRESLNITPYDTLWVPNSTRFVLLGGTARDLGSFSVYKMFQGKLENILRFEHDKPIRCGTFGAYSAARHIAYGDIGGGLYLVDPEKPSKPIFSYDSAHNGVVHSIHGCGHPLAQGASELITGGSDGYVRVWDIRQGSGPVVEVGPSEASQKRECWSVCFGGASSDVDRTITAGFDNGDVKMIDLKMGKLSWQVNVGGGVVSMDFDSIGGPLNKLGVSNLDGNLNIYDLKYFNEKRGYPSVKTRAHNGTVWRTKFVPTKKDLCVTTGGAGEVKLWKYTYPQERFAVDEVDGEYGLAGKVSLKSETCISTQPVSSFDWHPNREGLAVCSSFDQSVSVLFVTDMP
ncbi:hypothetical protein RCL1_006079 [Eukaryota sp. TZLM3-RCL]